MKKFSFLAGIILLFSINGFSQEIKTEPEIEEIYSPETKESPALIENQPETSYFVEETETAVQESIQTSEKPNSDSKETVSQTEIQQPPAISTPKETSELNGHNITVSALFKIQEIEVFKSKVLQSREKENKTSEKTFQKLLDKSYSDLLKTEYAALSATGELSFQILPFDIKEGGWTMIITSDFLNSKALFNQSILLPYEAVTGKKLEKIERMNSKEYSNYASTVILYDNILGSEYPNIALKLNYTIKDWNDASEYRFFPQMLEVYKTDRDNQLIYTIESSDFQSVSFNVSPQVEIRSESEIKRQTKENESILEREKSKYNKKHPTVATVKLPEQSYKKLERETKDKSQKKPVFQTGRSSFILNFTDYETQTELEHFDSSNIFIDNISATLNLGLGNFFFLPIDFGGQKNPLTPNTYMLNFGLGLGFSVNIANIIRPYAIACADYLTNKSVELSYGGGLDIVLGNIFVMNAQYKYNMGVCFETYNQGLSFMNNLYKFHSFSVGIGLCW